jgi:hypothetical protein
MLGLLMTGPFLLTVGILWADLGAEERAGFLVALDRWLPIGGLITIMALIVGLQLLRALFQQYVQGLLRMAETLRLMLGANRNFRVDPEGPPEVRELARAANDLAQQRDALLTDVEGADPARQGDGRGREEPARRPDVGTGDGRRGMQSRWTDPALQQPRAPAVQGAGAGTDLDERRRPDRARPFHLLHPRARADHAFAGKHPAPPAQGQRGTHGQLHHFDA